jgi:DNA-nicking Smr family endonuclease
MTEEDKSTFLSAMTDVTPIKKVTLRHNTTQKNSSNRLKKPFNN